MPSLVVEACSVLGIEPGPGGSPPDEEQVRAAFKPLAIKWHPDRNPDNVAEATQRFAELSAARDLLLDPPVSAMVDEQARASSKPYPKSAHSTNLRAFEGDVTDAIDAGNLSGADVEQQFQSFELWAVWHCRSCDLICCRIRKNKYQCMCTHKLAQHSAGSGFRCTVAKCPCRRYEFQVQFDHEPLKCRCKHGPKEHAPMPPFACQRDKCGCDAFASPWQCHCGHACAEHRTAFVQKKYAERAREWVTSGLRGECVALAQKFRSRSPRTRAAFVARANAARAAGLPSWKAMQREAAAHEKWGTAPLPPSEVAKESASAHSAEVAGAMDDPRPPDGYCGECEPSTSSQTSHGLSTEELRQKLAAAGVGVRPVNASDLGNLW
jgi:hypothetical protein